MRLRVVLVAAMDRNRVIGKNGDLPWRLRDDLKAFKELTFGAPVVMGRKTWDSIGCPLPGRRNLVLTRNADFRAEGAEPVSSPDAALGVVADAETVYVIGGGGVYQAFLPDADALVLTRVDTEVEGGDTWFPDWDPDAFRITGRKSFPADGRNQHPFVIETHVQTGPDR